MASKFKTDKLTGRDKAKFKKSFSKANLKMIKELAKDMYPVSESDVKKLLKASKIKNTWLQQLNLKVQEKNLRFIQKCQ